MDQITPFNIELRTRNKVAFVLALSSTEESKFFCTQFTELPASHPSIFLSTQALPRPCSVEYLLTGFDWTGFLSFINVPVSRRICSEANLCYELVRFSKVNQNISLSLQKLCIAWKMRFYSQQEQMYFS